MKHTVRLADNTIGTINSDTINHQDINGFIGEVMKVRLFDENGFPIEVSGKMIEVLESSEY